MASEDKDRVSGQNAGKHGRHAQDAETAHARHAGASVSDEGDGEARASHAAHVAPNQDAASASHGGASASNAAAENPAAAYAASNYGVAKDKKHGKKSKLKKFLPLIIILAVVAALAIAAAVYANELDAKLGFEDASNAEGVQSALTPAQDNQPFYVLLLGSDSRKYSESSDKKGVSKGKNYSDVMMLCRVDAANKKITLVSIPRDTRWYDPQRKKIRKINSAFNDGPARSIEAVEQLTGVKISHYAQINMDGFEGLVDAVGGITVNVPQTIGYKDMLTKEYIQIEKGTQTLNGQQAQIFARARHEYKDQEATRQSNNRQIVEALVTSIRNQPWYNMPNVGLAIASCLDTDLKSPEIIPLAMNFLQGDIAIYNGTGPTEGDIYQDDKLWYCYTNTVGWKKLMKTVEAGKDPSKLKYTTPQTSIDQAHNVVDGDTTTDPKTATDLSGTTY